MLFFILVSFFIILTCLSVGVLSQIGDAVTAAEDAVNGLVGGMGK